MLFLTQGCQFTWKFCIALSFFSSCVQWIAPSGYHGSLSSLRQSTGMGQTTMCEEGDTIQFWNVTGSRFLAENGSYFLGVGSMGWLGYPRRKPYGRQISGLDFKPIACPRKMDRATMQAQVPLSPDRNLACYFQQYPLECNKTTKGSVLLKECVSSCDWKVIAAWKPPWY